MMSLVLQLAKNLTVAPQPAPVAGFQLRNYESEADIAGWLDLREAAFAREKLGIRAWEATDFHQEFVTKPWWDQQHCWLVEDFGGPFTQVLRTKLIGSVTLAWRGEGPTARPVVHWLMVRPRYRARGLGRWLLASLERRVWELGERQVWLETHSAWESASRFYQAAGYSPASEIQR